MTRPFYVIAATPQKSLQFNDFFNSGGGSIVELLKNPPVLRRMGWDLVTLDNPRILKGECWEVNNGERKRIRLYKDGTVIFRAAVDDSFLCAGRNNSQPYPSINALALIEVTFNFVNFYTSIVKMNSNKTTEPFPILFQIKLNDMIPKVSGIFQVYLSVADATWDIRNKGQFAPETQMNKDLTIDILQSNFSVANVSYKILELIFAWFGIPSNDIPYTIIDTAGEKCIDISQITRTH